MDLLGDRRGQSIQIGAIILFGALIILLSTYQAFVVPDQNREVEFKHSQTVQNDLKEFRSGVISVASNGGTSSVSVELGTEYPSRAIFLNPGPPSGSLQTIGTGNENVNISVANATATGGTTEVGDYWNGTTRNYSSGDFVYRPNYNEYNNAPTTVYSNTVLYNQFEDGNLTLTDQSLVNGRSISLIALNGSLSTGQSGSVSLDMRATSASATRVPITNDSAGENVTVAVPTRLSETKWEELLQSQLVANGGHIQNDGISVVEQSGTFDRLVLEMEPGVTYNLKLSRVGVGSNVDTTTPARYLVKTRGQDTVVPEGQNVTLAVQARDRYNNPSSGELVQANASLGNVTESAESDGDGIVELVYSPPENINGGAEPVRINVSLNDAGLASPSFSGSTPENVTFTVSVDNTDGSGTTTGTSGSYSVEWETPSDSQVSSCPTAPPQGRCIAGSPTAFLYDLNLTMTTDPTADGADVTYAVSNQKTLGLERTTGVTAANGENTTVVYPLANGTEYVYTDSGSDGDRLELDVTVDDDISGTAQDPDNTGTNSGVQFSVTNDADRAVTITEMFVEPQDSAVGRLDDPVAGEGQWDSEFFFDVDGTTYTADFDFGRDLPFNFDLDDTGGNVGEEPTIGPGQTMDVYMYQFRDNGDNNNVSMDGRTLNMSFTFSNGVQKNFTVTMGGGGNTGGNNAYITGVSPDPAKLADSEGEFVKLYVPSGVDTSGWELADGDGNNITLSNVDGEVYYATSETAFANQWNGVSASDVAQTFSFNYNNGADRVVLRDSSGTEVDRFAYDFGSQDDTFSDGTSFTFSGEGQVANRSYSGGSYDDSDSAADFSEEAECDFFGGGNGCVQESIVFRQNNNLKSVNTGGTVTTYATSQPKAIGPKTADLGVGDSGTDIPFKGNNNGYLRGVTDGSSIASLDSSQINDYPIGVGDWDNDGTAEVVYSKGSEIHEYDGSVNQLEYSVSTGSYDCNNGQSPCTVDAQAIAGVGDITGDGNNEIVYVDDDDGDLVYFDGNDEFEITGSLGNTKSVSTPGDFDGDGRDEVAVKTGNQELTLYDSDGSDGAKTTGYQVRAAPMGAHDWNGDGRTDVIHLDNSGNLRFFDWVPGNPGFVTDTNGNNIKASSSQGAR